MWSFESSKFFKESSSRFSVVKDLPWKKFLYFHLEAINSQILVYKRLAKPWKPLLHYQTLKSAVLRKSLILNLCSISFQEATHWLKLDLFTLLTLSKVSLLSKKSPWTSNRNHLILWHTLIIHKGALVLMKPDCYISVKPLKN